MSKVICDICGTTYQDTAECCPICGCSPKDAAELIGEELLVEDAAAAGKGKGGLFSSNKKKEIFDYDEVNTDLDEELEEDPYDEEEYEVSPQHNTFVVILLTVLITVLLAAVGYLFVRYFLPNILDKEEIAPPTETQIVETTEQTTEPRIPCQSLSLPGGAAQIDKEGYYFLLNVVVLPEDTTDELVFSSADESIATVTEDGRITAVSEGKTVIYITCGDKQLSCPVTCDFTEETVPETTEETVPETTEETTPETTLPEVELKLDRTDMRLNVGYYTQLVPANGLKPEDIEWSVEHPNIAAVENGKVTALQTGTTEVIAKYGDQEVRCIVRCYVS